MRYSRQILLPSVGPAGQRRLSESHALIVGCGALGCAAAELLARGGVGRLTLIDRDLVEWSNLQRQILFDQTDAGLMTPKAAAAAARLAAINSTIAIEALVADIYAANIEDLLNKRIDPAQPTILLDGTDNAATRYLLNDFCVKNRLPWVYGACVGYEGRAMLIEPGISPCLRCLWPQPPAAGQLPTCDTAGVLAAAAVNVASWQAALATGRLIAGPAARPPSLIHFDMSVPTLRALTLPEGPVENCPCCRRRQWEFLDARTEPTTQLCGQTAVQVRLGHALDWAGTLQRLTEAGTVRQTRYLIHCVLREPPGVELRLFPDGRAMVHGTNDPAQARSLLARWVGM